MRTTPSLLLLLALVLPSTATASPRRGVQVDVEVEPLPALVAVASPAGARCRILARGAPPFEAVAPFEAPVRPGRVDVDCVLPSGRLARQDLRVRPAERTTLRIHDRRRAPHRCPPGGCYERGPLPEPAFASLHRAVAREPFSDGRLELLESAAPGAWFTVRQVDALLGLFGHSSDRVAVVEILAPRLWDRQNAHRLLDRFPFSEDRARVRWLLGTWDRGRPVARR